MRSAKTTCVLVTAIAVCVAFAAVTFGQSPAPRETPRDSTRIAAAAELVANPTYATWAAAAVGTSVTTRVDAALNGGQAVRYTVTATLRAVAADAVTLDVELTGPDLPEKRDEVKVPARVPPDRTVLPDVSGGARRVGTETLTVDGVGYACEVVEVVGDRNGRSVAGRVWTSASMPGYVVKTDLSGTAAPAATMTMRGEVTAVRRGG